MAAERTAEVTWTGDLMKGNGTTALRSSGLADALPVSWASRTENADGKTSPEELLAAAHASCFSMALSGGLARGGHPPERLDVSATATFEKVEAGFRVTRMRLRVQGTVPGIDAAAFQEAASAAKDGCPISQALKGNVEISVEASLA